MPVHLSHNPITARPFSSMALAIPAPATAPAGVDPAPKHGFPILFAFTRKSRELVEERWARRHLPADASCEAIALNVAFNCDPSVVTT
jgi:hypothetical protein